MTKESGRKIIEQKVEDFEKNALVLKKKGHGETNIRTNYIDVLFEALGWNMKSHYDVLREYSQRDTSGTKKVDYAFKINGKLKFFVEAKEASIDLEHDRDAIYQAKRYAYSTNGKAPIIILTDFEAFRVFNVLKAPAYDNTERELLKHYSMNYSDYLKNWDLLWDSFSKEAVGSGNLEALRGKIDKNTRTMDIDFLDQITGWREDLARNVAIRNKELSVDEINEAVQRILDRLLFIRNLEDREIEPENTLLDKTKLSDNIYKSIIRIFNSLDNVYNGLLFKKHFSEELAIDDKTVKDIIKSMCYPVSPFQFDVIEPEILGRIYEKFLGSKIRLTENHQAKIEEKIEVRKAGGVYYTPEYIVNYIVENTVGKKIEGLSPEEIKKIKILDPACGSGSFLLGAYSYILDYHAKWYLAHKSDKAYKADHYVNANGDIKVSLENRGNILRSNIFGVDIDQEATEVAIMSLYLKMLDDGFDKGQKDLFFVKGHVLPDMTNNVKCGNSLIGTDYFDGKLDFSSDEFKEIKPFDWHSEFKEIFAGGGFDVVIGNPPYIPIESIPDNQKNYFQVHFKQIERKFDTSIVFILNLMEKLNPTGLLAYISSLTWQTGENYSRLREHIFTNYGIDSLINLPFNTFKDAYVDTGIYILSKRRTESYYIYRFPKKEIITNLANIPFKSIAVNLVQPPDFKVILDPISAIILQRLNNNADFISFGDLTVSTQGLAGNMYKVSSDGGKDKYPFFETGQVYRYSFIKEQISYTDMSDKPSLTSFYNAKPKLLIRRVINRQDRIMCTYFEEQMVFKKDINPFILHTLNRNESLCFLGILNSKLISYIYINSSSIATKDDFRQTTLAELRKLPLPKIEKIKETEVYNKVVSFVEQMLKSQNELHSAKSDADKRLSEQKVDMLDKKIDELVYRLYDLTDEEIKIVEGSA